MAGSLRLGRSVRTKTRRSAAQLATVLHRSVVGESVAASAAAVALGVVLAVANAWLVGTSVGADAIAERVLAALSGQAPVVGVLVASGVLVALGAASALASAGFVPTVLLVSSPIFGIGITRWGVEQVVLGTTQTIPLSEAALDAAGAAVVFGVPLAALGFAVGVAVRWTQGVSVDVVVDRD